MDYALLPVHRLVLAAFNGDGTVADQASLDALLALLDAEVAR